MIDVNGLGAGGNGRSCVIDPSAMAPHQSAGPEDIFPIEIDLAEVRRQRETGLRGLGQVAKSFGDRAVDFSVCDRASGRDACSIYGAVPLREIKHQLLALKAEGKLDRVRMLLLTNCTFGGVVYNVEWVMEECLAIKPNLTFLWGEAWLAFMRFCPTYRQRTGMSAANTPRERLKSEAHAKAYAAQAAKLKDADDAVPLKTRLIRPPSARVRVYTTQSSDKTLTSLRQGSMIPVNEQDFKGEVEQSFHEAYMTHTSTSPNYRIIASLDVGRRQVELEGFEFVQRQAEAAMPMRKAISTHPLLQKYFKMLTAGDMIPESDRESGVTSYSDPHQRRTNFWDCREMCSEARARPMSAKRVPPSSSATTKRTAIIWNSTVP